MKEWFLHLWESESEFKALIRGGLALGGALLPLIPGVPIWVGPIAVALTQFISAGQMNTERRK